MIDYSVYKQANPMNESAAPKAYAKAQMRESMSFSDFVNHIASHNSIFSRGTVRGVLSDACLCIVEQLLEGKKVQLGELGNFWISLTSTGADSLESFSANNIKEVNIIFTPGEDFQNLRSRATFNAVAGRVAQSATLKAEKTGSTVVDLEAARAAARPASSGTGSGTNSNVTGNGANSGGNSTSNTPLLTINHSGTGASTVSAGGSTITSGAELAAGTEVSISVTPAQAFTPTATLNGELVTLNENDGVFSGSFIMPSEDATLAINSGSTSNDNGDDLGE